MKNKSVKDLFDSFQNHQVLIIGDVMIDSYISGDVKRMSPEAPVPVVSVTEKTIRLGGAANVALNVQSLGAKAFVCAVTGDDNQAKELFTLFKENKLAVDGLIKINGRPTTVKTRVISNDKHVLRIDEEVETDISSTFEKQLFLKISSIIKAKNISVVIFQDYNKGCITASLIKDVVKLAHEKNIPVVVDPKKKNFLAYKGVDLFKPNLKELKDGLKLSNINPENNKDIEKSSDLLRKKTGAKYILLTLSQFGVYISDGKQSSHFKAYKRKIVDVSGAGDTVVAVAALCLAAKTDSETIAKLSNLAGGLVCEKAGVVPVDKKLLEKEAVTHT